MLVPIACTLNGAKWRAIKGSSPNPGNPLRGVVALAPDDVWVVGATGSGPALQTLAEHADGSAWTVVATPNHTDSELDWLEDVTAIGPADLWAVGYWQSASDGNLRTLVEDWDGSAWTVVPSPNVGVILNELFGVSASPDGDVWAVGERSGTSGTNLFTLTEHYC